MKYNIEAIIKLVDETNPKIIRTAIAPENVTMPDGKVETIIDKNKVITKIIGKMTIGRLTNTIDDIIKTAILAKNVAKD